MTQLTRLVSGMWIGRAPIDFRVLCERAVPREATLIVFDLDRTVHFGKNMGELLGWEISAHRGYGPRYLSDLEPSRPSGRVVLDREQPLATLRYMWKATRVWGPPGVFYFRWGKLASRVAAVRRSAFARFGPEPVRAVQSVPQYVLMKQIAALPDADVRELMRRMWARHTADQVIERAHIDWLRKHAPNARIVLCSASPVPVVEVAAEALGITEAMGSTLGRINSNRAKLDALRLTYPELGRRGEVTVGISDTGYGEDHPWADAFNVVIDVNSDTPFPPIVAATSPLTTIYSSPVLTRAEKDAIAAGQPIERGDNRAPSILGATDIAKKVGKVADEVERLSHELEDSEASLADELAPQRLRMSGLLDRLADLEPRPRPFDAPTRGLLRDLLDERREVQDLMAKAARPASAIAFKRARAIERARRAVDA